MWTVCSSHPILASSLSLCLSFFFFFLFFLFFYFVLVLFLSFFLFLYFFFWLGAPAIPLPALLRPIRHRVTDRVHGPLPSYHFTGAPSAQRVRLYDDDNCVRLHLRTHPSATACRPPLAAVPVRYAVPYSIDQCHLAPRHRQIAVRPSRSQRARWSSTDDNSQ